MPRGRPKNPENFFKQPKSNRQFSEGQKSKGILDDYAVRKDTQSSFINTNHLEITPFELTDERFESTTLFARCRPKAGFAGFTSDMLSDSAGFGFSIDLRGANDIQGGFIIQNAAGDTQSNPTGESGFITINNNSDDCTMDLLKLFNNSESNGDSIVLGCKVGSETNIMFEEGGAFAVDMFEIAYDGNASSPNNVLRIRSASGLSGIDTDAITFLQDGSMQVHKLIQGGNSIIIDGTTNPGTITETNGEISFDDENLTTTGDITTGKKLNFESTDTYINNDSDGILNIVNNNSNTSRISLIVDDYAIEFKTTGGNFWLAPTASIIQDIDLGLASTGLWNDLYMKGTANIGNMAIASGSITDSSGAISFGDENLTTTGDITGAIITGNTRVETLGLWSDDYFDVLGNQWGTANSGDFTFSGNVTPGGTLLMGANTIDADDNLTINVGNNDKIVLTNDSDGLSSGFIGDFISYSINIPTHPTSSGGWARPLNEVTSTDSGDLGGFFGQGSWSTVAQTMTNMFYSMGGQRVATIRSNSDGASVPFDDSDDRWGTLTVGDGDGDDTDARPGSISIILNDDPNLASDDWWCTGVLESGTYDNTNNIAKFNIKSQGIRSGGPYHSQMDFYTTEDASEFLNMSLNWEDGNIIYNDLELQADLTFTGAGKGMTYGEISVINGSTNTTLNSTGGKVQITTFTTDGLSNNTTPDAANDEIGVDTGVYMVNISMTAENKAGASNVIEIGLFNAGGTTAYSNIHAHRTLGAGTDIGSISLSGIIDVTAATDLELWANTDRAVNTAVLFSDIVISITKIGGT